MEASLQEPRPFFGPGAFAVDSSDRLWVVTSRVVGDSTELDVFAPGGALLQTLRLPDTVLSFAFRGSRAAVLVARRRPDVEGFHGVDVYRLIEGG
jgi:sugar lactone lactonase YvrE